MNESMWGIFFIVIGVLGIFFINLFEDITSTNDQNYYLLKETTEAAMFDSIDLATFRNEGKLRIVKEKFVENFTRRYTESTNIQKSYNIEFLDIMEEPPKVTIRVSASSTVTFTEENLDINYSNALDAILETEWDGSKTNPGIANCSVEFTPGYLKEGTTNTTRQVLTGYEECNCRTISPTSPYEVRHCIMCKNPSTGKTREICCDCGTISTPMCGGDSPNPEGLSYPVACKSSYRKCDQCPTYSTIVIPVTYSEYIPPEYKIVCSN